MGFLRLVALCSQPLGARRGLGRGCHRRTHRPVDDGRECPGRLGRASLRATDDSLVFGGGCANGRSRRRWLRWFVRVGRGFPPGRGSLYGHHRTRTAILFTPSHFIRRRAIIISFHSMMGSAGSVFCQLGLGYLSRAYSISIGYIVGGLVTVTVLPLLALLRRLREPEDLIVGTARDRGACAAQGLPNVTAVETAARTS